MDYDLLDEAIHARAAALNDAEAGDAWAVDALDDLRASLDRIRAVVEAASYLRLTQPTSLSDLVRGGRFVAAIDAITDDDRRLLGME